MRDVCLYHKPYEWNFVLCSIGCCKTTNYSSIAMSRTPTHHCSRMSKNKVFAIDLYNTRHPNIMYTLLLHANSIEYIYISADKRLLSCDESFRHPSSFRRHCQEDNSILSKMCSNVTLWHLVYMMSSGIEG